MSVTPSSSDYQNPEAIAIIQANRDLLLQTMPSLGISEITIEYESYADSGDVTALKVFPESQLTQIDKCQLPYQFLILARNGQGQYYSAGEVQQVSMRVALCDFALSCLGIKYPDWDTEEGAEGKVILDADEQRCELIHTQYFMEYARHSPYHDATQPAVNNTLI